MSSLELSTQAFKSVSTILINLTPTTASDAKKDNNFLKALTHLNIISPTASDDYFLSNDIIFDFDWHWRDGREEVDSYEPLQQQLLQAKFFAISIASGQHCHNSNLFDEEFWSLRKVIDDNVLLIGYVKGRTDLVVLKEEYQGSYITRNMVRFGIEIKKQDMISSSSGLASAIREVSTQLIGLTAGNTNNCPSMILTDLTQCHFCVYLFLNSKSLPFSFAIKVQKCANLASALVFAGKEGDFLDPVDLRPICYNFARKPTPVPSLRDDLEAFNDNDELDNLL